jgi:hypothetical protein
MARVLVAAQTQQNPFIPTLPVTPGSRHLTFQVCDPSLKNYTPLVSGKTVVHVKNVHATDPKTVTFTSVVDVLNRTGDIAYSVPAGEVHDFGPFQTAGWSQAGAQLWFEGSSTDITFAVVTQS